MHRSCVLAATTLLVACPSSSPGPQPPRAPIDSALRIQIAKLEVARQASFPELLRLATIGEVHQRELAVRALGRIGGAKALAFLQTATGDADPVVATAAVGAIGVAVSLDEQKPEELHGVSAALVSAASTTDPRVACEAIGRAGDASAQSMLVVGLRAKPEVAEVCALALGRHGRRKIALGDYSRQALIDITRSADPRIRYAATYALSREFFAAEPPAAGVPGDPLRELESSALAERIQRDENPEVRAVAIAGIARRGVVDKARRAIEDSLRDRDWRVAVEAVRALAGEHGDDAGRDAVAGALLRRWTELAGGSATEAHVITEGLRLLAKHGDRPLVAAAATSLATSAPTADHVAPLARGWIGCLATAVTLRATKQPDVEALATCGHDELPDHLRLPLLADLVTDGAGDATTHRAALRLLLAHSDPRVRAAGLGALPATWKEGDDNDHRALVGTLAQALATAKDLVVAGAAVDAATTLYEAMGPSPDKPTLDAAVVARATAEQDAELSAALYDLIGKRTIAAGADACRAGLSREPVRAKAAAECLRALGEPAPAKPSPAPAPPIDVASVIGHTVIWHLATTRGELTIELRPDVAPWNVATIVALTRKGFYDGLEFHRVVPDFVVQGGDPTMTGAGGPGFTTPAEPATLLDGSFTAGGVGIADAGRDSGGSQWFVMHSWAPHLEGRYTWIGATRDKSADALLIGDKVIKATVEVE